MATSKPSVNSGIVFVVTRGLDADESAMEVAFDAIRVHGGYGYSKEYDVERYFRDAPLMICRRGHQRGATQGRRGTARCRQQD